jgi:mono/diheme cytochrome c family protein
MKHLILKVAALMLIAFGLWAFTGTTAQDGKWDVPDKYKKMENPQEANNESLKVGKRLWSKHCKSCHGSEGLGDGSKAATLDTPAGDFTADVFTSQTDGTIFFKSKFGKGDMPNYEKKIPYDEDLWHLVNFIRTFSE